LSEAEFPDTDLSKAEFPDADLSKAEFPDADLSKAEFPDADLSEAKFLDADLSKAEFPDADLSEAKFLDADLSEAKFLGTNLQRANLSEANIQEAEFFDADLRGAAFRPACAIVVGPEESTTDPLGASLENAQFEDGTDLRDTNLSGARLYQTAFRDVRINGETQFGIKDGRYGEKCRYEYDPNTGVSTNEGVPRLRAAAWTYRRLESLFEENAMDRRARNAHIRKQEAQRKHQFIGAFEPILRTLPDPIHEQIPQRFRQHDSTDDSWIISLGQYFVSTINWRLHRHGESLRQLLIVSAFLIITCGILYVSPWSGVARNNPETTDVITYQITTVAELTLPEVITTLLNGLYFSIITFSTIGYGDFYPASPVSRLLVGFESLAGALLIALFVFVIGRRVAR
ncbi:pentapeptide repeat-containing protein, partial [Halorubrum sp. Eb13]|uniref:pentapeptide repeat-containing protein n=1 Tax=Halorubrum sp. Eb13 TaxID=1383843 RepID=UPI000B99270E